MTLICQISSLLHFKHLISSPTHGKQKNREKGQPHCALMEGLKGKINLAFQKVIFIGVNGSQNKKCYRLESQHWVLLCMLIKQLNIIKTICVL